MEAPKITLSEPELEALEDRILMLCGQINAAEYRFLKLLADYDRADGWSRHGVASCVQWLNWQCGIGAVAARERVRTARALKHLPLIAAAFCRGEVSYSKVRAMTRVATPENEATLLTIALHGTATHVEKLVRKYRWVRRRHDAERVEEQHRKRYLETYWDDGALVIRGRLPGEAGALVKQAIEAALAADDQSSGQRPIENQTQSNVSAETAGPARGSDRAEDARGRYAVAIETQSNVSAETSASDTRFDGADTSTPTVIKVNDAIDPKHVAETPDDSIGARRADALVRVARHFLASDTVDVGSTGDRYQVVVHVDQALLSDSPAAGGASPADARPHRCEYDDGRALAIDTARRLACDAALVGLVENDDGQPLSVGRRTRAIPAAIRRALKARDGGCRFPGCTHTRYTEGHHVVHWADGGETKLANLITLCGFHHRLVHEGGFGLRATDDGLFVFFKPGGTRLAEAGRLDRHPNEGSLGETFSGIDANTARSRWIGEPMDYGWATAVLCENDGLR